MLGACRSLPQVSFVFEKSKAASRCTKSTTSNSRFTSYKFPVASAVQDICISTLHPEYSTASLFGNFATLGITLALPIVCVPPEERDVAARGLSTAAFNLMFPSLLLVQTAAVVGSGIEPSAVAGILGVAVAQIAVGALAGATCAYGAGLRSSAVEDSSRFRQAVTASAFGNATTLPLVLGSSLCLTLPPLVADPGSADRLAGYLALYQLAWSTLLWTVGYGYLCGGEGGGARGTVGRLASPPSLGSLAGAALGFMGANAAAAPDSPAFPVYSALTLLGSGAQPALAMLLSLSLLGGAQAPAPATDVRQLLATVAARGALVPLAGGAAVEWAWAQPGLLPDDPVAHLVLLLEAAMPSAQVLVLLAQVRRRQQDDGGAQAAAVSRLLLAQYAAMLVPISLWLPVFLSATF